jgi:tol-pal system protein YbgF
MKLTLVIALAVALPLSIFAQKKEVVELQRDVALLQDQVRNMQRTLDEKTTALMLLAQQSLESSNRTNTALALLQTTTSEKLGEQSKAVGGTVAGIGTKVDQMSDEFRSVRESIADLNARMGKLDAKLAEISNAIRTIQAPASPPPGVPAAGSAPSGQAPPATATYENAMRDLSGGKRDLALQEFQDYLKWYKQTDLAPNAQYYIGEIYLRQNDADSAIKAFDAVLEQYSENNKTADAHYMKATALLQSGQRTAAQKEYCEVIRRYPSSDLATKAKSALKGMGYSSTCGVASARPVLSKKKRR